MEKEEFEKKRSLLVRNGLNIVKALEDTFKAILKYNWYEDWEYPDEIRNLDGSKLDSVDIIFLFERIRFFVSELDNFPDKLESLREKGLKSDFVK